MICICGNFTHFTGGWNKRVDDIDYTCDKCGIFNGDILDEVVKIPEETPSEIRSGIEALIEIHKARQSKQRPPDNGE